MKIAAQKIGLDLVRVKPPTQPMTSGYIDFKIDEVLTTEEILFQMRKVKRASEKVVEKMSQIENRFKLELMMINITKNVK